MPIIKSQLAILSADQNLILNLAEHDPVVLSAEDLTSHTFDVHILVYDSRLELAADQLSALSNKKNREFKKTLLLLEKGSSLPARVLSQAKSDQYLYIEDLQPSILHQIWQDISQKEQEEVYLNLSSELNQQYEIIKNELQRKLKEESKNLQESRRQISEITTRVEVLRKSLFATTEVKSLQEAEVALNKLLIGFDMVSWLKIVPEEQVAAFEIDLDKSQESHCYNNQLTIGEDSYTLYFYKKDRRAFKKQDLNYFDKLAEALEINLNRYNNLLSLQQNERLFDLAFHSSPYPIIIINSDYTVSQANLAAEKKASTDSDKCYQLLFGRNKPCAGCQLGSRFEVQHDVRTYAVQSSKFNNLLDSERNYWIHMYEDISEQKALESKFQQTARLSELGLISSSIAHELNNPLGGIISYLQIMKMELPADHPFQSDLQFLMDAANRMKKHIEDLLFFSRKDDPIKLETVNLAEVFRKNLDLLQMQLKKEHLMVSFQEPATPVPHAVSVLHFRNIIHLAFQFFLYKLKFRRQSKPSFNGLVEVKISQDQISSYLSLAANLGPHDLKLNTNDLSLITLEKSILDQGFQLVISEPQAQWIQLLIKIPR
ncbi:histidine kinase dimerization/phospho-acceptor domain-containing protein [Pseudobdellovibrio exovorus]|uniref:histidine kinase n=1 Tax=Pseudobdellovibrio exovorus JSS TaxID=1184267 RepID=M4VD17_9BACT|nr:histidine kinase dimerization/phospho-acceptor domain-containing protein [Pseudobdellovibrio exovorus]AGH96380.1 two-component sensor histidine kinase [Pseudobdellovibrio exovorus JSS]